PSALQLRLLQTIVAVAAEKNSTLVLPFPVELLRFLERAQQPAPGHAPEPRPEPDGPRPGP
ncbi:slipin family protein, partial [Streptomyces sp. NPDC044984]